MREQAEGLLGELIGLAHAAANNQPDGRTDAVVARALMDIADECAKETQMEDTLRAILREKRRLAPNCATCASPCGRTAAFPVHTGRALPHEEGAIRMALLRALQGAARDIEGDAERANKVYEGLCMLGEEWATDAYRQMIEALRVDE
ncbi:MAG: hypothetical protein IJ234_03150 [Clostridia bacterium]|nr:hypothetical protein [Clostridia bacterium]